jgi:hypothetical protein
MIKEMRQAWLNPVSFPWHHSKHSTKNPKHMNLTWMLFYRVEYGEAVYLRFNSGKSIRMEHKNDDCWSFNNQAISFKVPEWYEYYVGKWDDDSEIRPVCF